MEQQLVRREGVVVWRECTDEVAPCLVRWEVADAGGDRSEPRSL